MFSENLNVPYFFLSSLQVIATGGVLAFPCSSVMRDQFLPQSRAPAANSWITCILFLVQPVHCLAGAVCVWLFWIWSWTWSLACARADHRDTYPAKYATKSMWRFFIKTKTFLPGSFCILSTEVAPWRVDKWHVFFSMFFPGWDGDIFGYLFNLVMKLWLRVSPSPARTFVIVASRAGQLVLVSWNLVRCLLRAQAFFFGVSRIDPTPVHCKSQKYEVFLMLKIFFF